MAKMLGTGLMVFGAIMIIIALKKELAFPMGGIIDGIIGEMFVLTGISLKS